MGKKTEYRQVKINLLPEEYERISEQAEADGVTKAEWIRRRIGTKIEDKDLRSPQKRLPQKQADPKLLYEINRIGININKMTTWANKFRTLDRQILSSLVGIEAKLQAILDDC